ncbi:TlpA disulfide reductase family protein [Streptococcus ictaluri]|uniref:Redoxin n=1 Tax=Streptococcus ictaluri 707-05 TaxID=764299 RepID=G5K121_9STRE|nr:TlpA disulfide reductase family protein [Streptococcus ictaluri]EHI70430.1 redoxin [Streptococcus ictaluri 707-05]
MAKGKMVAAGMACLALLTACSAKDKMTNNDMTKNQTSMAQKDSKMMTDKKMSDTKEMPNQGKAVDFELKDINGKTYRLADFKGKKVYLKFWASWCSICLSTLDDTQKLAEMSDKDYEVITVVSPGHQGEKSEEDFKKWFSGTDFKQLPVLLDPEGKLIQAYGVRSYPTELFIDSKGNVAKKHIGYAKKADIEKNLKEIN